MHPGSMPARVRLGEAFVLTPKSWQSRRCSLCLGARRGCTAIVCQSADLEVAVPSIGKEGFYHAGQVCVSTPRVYVHESIYDVFVEKLCAVVGVLAVGDAAYPGTEVGPLTRPAEGERIAQWIDAAFWDDAITCAGLNASGLGVGGIPYTIEDMQFEKMMVIK